MTRTSTVSGSRRPRRWAATLVLGGLVSACTNPRSTTAAPLPDPRDARAIPPEHGRGPADACAACHPDITREWRGSRHAGAWLDHLVRREYQQEPDRSCVRCHAPLTPAGDEPEGRAARDGVDCGVCHVRGTRAEHLLLAGAPAGPLRSRAGAGSMFCGTCHQFHFELNQDPAKIGYDPNDWLQSTLTEWLHSDAARADRHCQDCHMPWVTAPDGRRHRAHTFTGMLDGEFVAQAVRVDISAARRGGVVHVRAAIAPGDIGHAFPTGDMFREAVLRVWTDERESASDERRLRRWFDTVQRVHPNGATELVLRQVDDTRVPPPGAGPAPTYAFQLRSPAARTVSWSLDLFARSREEAEAEAQGQRVRTRVAAGQVTIAPDPTRR